MGVKLSLIPGTLALVALVFLTSCSDDALIEQRVAELNKRIDQLDITSEEILVRANSMNELELTVSAMEERQTARLRKVLAREAIAKKRVVELDAEILEMEAKIKLLEAQSQSYPKSLADKKQSTEERLNEIMEKIEKSVDLAPRPGEEKVILIERLLEKVEKLELENAKFREAASKP